jgi:hypothetical protein
MSNPFLRAYEFEKRYGLDRLKITIEKAEKAYSTLEPETIDLSKSVLESMCASILDERGQLYQLGNGPKVQVLVGATLQILGLKSPHIAGNIKGLAGGLGDIRNDETIAGHGLKGSHPLISKRDIKLFVSTCSHLWDMILHLLDEEEVDLSSTKLTFDAAESVLNLAEINEAIDKDIDVSYSQEDGILFIEGKELKPSRVLYELDRPSYKNKVDVAKAAAAEAENNRLIQLFSSLIETALSKRFDDFHPGHFGIDEIGIEFRLTNIADTRIDLEGWVNTSAMIGSSNPQDGMSIDYESAFSAKLELLDPEDAESWQIETLNLDTVDWIQPDLESEDYGT